MLGATTEEHTAETNDPVGSASCDTDVTPGEATAAVGQDEGAESAAGNASEPKEIDGVAVPETVTLEDVIKPEGYYTPRCVEDRIGISVRAVLTAARHTHVGFFTVTRGGDAYLGRQLTRWVRESKTDYAIAPKWLAIIKRLRLTSGVGPRPVAVVPSDPLDAAFETAEAWGADEARAEKDRRTEAWEQYVQALTRDGDSLSGVELQAMADVLVELRIDREQVASDRILVAKAGAMRAAHEDMPAAREELKRLRDIHRSMKADFTRRLKEADRAERLANSRVHTGTSAAFDLEQLRRTRPQIFETIQDGNDIPRILGDDDSESG